ncbi:MAG: Flagellar hook-associated protein FliD [Phycisphaerales bacterium]|nr:Flagellar hook-associated protein FliD [Phycisphaerales bacterium]
MGRISTGIGLVSGINSKDIIDQLIKLESRPKDILQTRVDSANQQRLAYTDIQARLSSIRVFGQSIQKTTTFAAATTASSDENVLTASASNGAAIGAFQFQVARLVTTQQSVSKGYTDINAKVGAGTITIEQGGGEVSSSTLLSELRGGQGIRRGVFRITDSSGHSASIDVSAAVSLDDVIKKINTSLDITVRASVSGDKLKLTDTSGLSTAAFSVTDLGEGQAASDLGLAGVVAASGVITGGDIHYLSTATTLNGINDGRGIRKASSGNDIAITAGGTTYNVSLASAKTLGDVFDLIKTGTSGAVTASVNPSDNGVTLTGSGAITVADLGDSKAATDLGIAGSGAGTISGGPLLAGIDSVLVASLNGGSGLTLGSIQITNALGVGATVDLSGAKSVQDVLDAISGAGINVKGTLNQSGNGIQVQDNSGGTGLLTIAEAGGGTTATDLGLLGTAATGQTAIAGKNLQRQWVSANTLLADYNGGKGVSPGSFRITNSAGKAATVNLATGTKFTIGDVIRDINSKSLGVTASINTHGDGLLLTDTAGGGLQLKVENISGTSATDLNIAGTAATATTTIDGSFEKTLTLDANDTLATVQTKLTTLNFGVLAQVISDGSSTVPFRLSLTAKNAGRNGRVVFDGGATNVGTRNLVEAQNAAVFLGSSNSAEPLLITSNSNQVSGVIRGVTVELHGTSDKPVTLGVTRSVDGVVDQFKKFADDFNGLVDKIKDLTKFDPATKEQGLLLGDNTVRTVESNLYVSLNTIVAGAGRYRTLADVGVTLGDGAKVQFNEEKFRAAYATDPDGVQNLFTAAGNALGTDTPVAGLNSNRGVRTLGVGQDDFKIGLRDGTSVNVSLGSLNTLNDVINAINTAAGTKLKAAIRDDGKGLRLTDLTGSTTASLTLTALSGSQSLYDLGLSGTAVGTILDGSKIVTGSSVTDNSAGVGFAITSSITKLIDPVNGIVTRENKTLDDRTLQFQNRITDLDQIIAQKRARLEKQFANMESVLAGLQTQQQSLGQIQTFKP